VNRETGIHLTSGILCSTKRNKLSHHGKSWRKVKWKSLNERSQPEMATLLCGSNCDILEKAKLLVSIKKKNVSGLVGVRKKERMNIQST